MFFFLDKNHLKVSEFKDQKLIWKMSCYKKDSISKTKSNDIAFFKIPIMKFLVVTNFDGSSSVSCQFFIFEITLFQVIFMKYHLKIAFEAFDISSKQARVQELF